MESKRFGKKTSGRGSAASDRVVAGPIGGFWITEREGRYHFGAPDGTLKKGLSLSEVYAVEKLIKQLREGEPKP